MLRRSVLWSPPAIAALLWAASCTSQNASGPVAADGGDCGTVGLACCSHESCSAGATCVSGMCVATEAGAPPDASTSDSTLPADSGPGGSDAADSAPADTGTAPEAEPTCGGLGQACCGPSLCNAGLECASLDGPSLCRCPANNCTATLLASAPARFLAVDSANLYWSETTRVARVALAGAASPQTLVPMGAVGIAVDTSHVYFASNSDVFAMPLDGVPDGGSPVNLGMVASQSSTPEAFAVAVDKSSVYASSYAPGSALPISKLPLAGLPDGGSALVLGQTDPHIPTRVLVDPTAVYWSGVGAVQGASLDGGPATDLGQVDASAYEAQVIAAPLAEDDSYVYTSDRAHVLRVPKTAGDGGPAEVLQSAQPGDFVTAVAVDGTRLYWAEQSTDPVMLRGYVFVAQLGGGSPVSIATHAVGTVAGMFDVVVDATHVYWTTGQSVFALPK